MRVGCKDLKDRVESPGLVERLVLLDLVGLQVNAAFLDPLVLLVPQDLQGLLGNEEKLVSVEKQEMLGLLDNRALQVRQS